MVACFPRSSQHGGGRQHFRRGTEVTQSDGAVASGRIILTSPRARHVFSGLLIDGFPARVIPVVTAFGCPQSNRDNWPLPQSHSRCAISGRWCLAGVQGVYDVNAD